MRKSKKVSPRSKKQKSRKVSRRSKRQKPKKSKCYPKVYDKKTKRCRKSRKIKRTSSNNTTPTRAAETRIMNQERMELIMKLSKINRELRNRTSL